MKYKLFDPFHNDRERIFRLFEKVYGDSKAIRERWSWEFTRNPMAGRIRVFVAERGDGDLAGMTVRMPCDLKVGDKTIPAFFATNSMVDPDFRGQGIIQRLYALASEDKALHLSKGTTPEMYRQLIKMGYRAIEPNRYQVAALAPLSLLIARLAGKAPRIVEDKNALQSFPDFRPVEEFGEEHVALPIPVTIAPLHSKEWLGWRYKEAPHRRYIIYERRENERLLSWCVLRFAGSGAMLTDLRWSPENQDEPGRTIEFSKALARRHGAVKLTAWFNNGCLRKFLKKNHFMGRKGTPRFSYFSHDMGWQEADWNNAYFSHGDGDSEYL